MYKDKLLHNEMFSRYLPEEIFLDLVEHYQEDHRFHHNINHIVDMTTYLMKLHYDSEIEKFITYYTILFHDVIYDPTRNDNEINSSNYLVDKVNELKFVDPTFLNKILPNVVKLIEDSGNLEYPSNINKPKLYFFLGDFKPLMTDNISQLIEYEHNIFKEFQFASYGDYKKARISFLEKCKDMIPLFDVSTRHNTDNLINYIDNRKLNVGIFAGSFNPYHVGHHNVFLKACKLFDKVIVAKGNNPNKVGSSFAKPSALKYFECDSYNGLITDYLDKVQEDKNVNSVTLVRGIRNGNDLSYESNQKSYIDDIRLNTNIIYIPTDKEFEHVSSSSIRILREYNNPDILKRYIP